MKGYNQLVLHNSQPAEVQNNPEDNLWYFPPIRVADDTTSAHHPQQMQKGYEAGGSDFPPKKKRKNTPSTPPLCTHSQHRSSTHPHVTSKISERLPSFSSRDKSSQLQGHQQPREGLGQANILNCVDALEGCAKVLLHPIYGPFAYQKLNPSPLPCSSLNSH